MYVYVSVKFTVTLHEKKFVSRAPYSIKLQSVTQLDTMVKSMMTETVLS